MPLVIRVPVPLRFPFWLAAIALCAGPAAAQAPSAPTAVTVTSDSESYCDDLARRLPAAASVEVTRLWHEGKAMCDEGHVRSGIMQLRRALLLAREEKTDPP